MQMQQRSRQCDLREQRQPQHHRGAERKGQRAERDDRRDLFGAQTQGGVRPIADGTAAQRIETDVMADGVPHEGNQGQARIGHLGAGETQAQGVVKRQAPVTRPSQQHRAQELRGADRLHVGENVPPAILGDDMMQPE